MYIMFIFHYILDTDFPSRRDYLFPIQSFKKKMWTLCSKVNPWIKWLYKSIDLSLISWNLFVIGLINGKWFPQEIFIFFGQFRFVSLIFFLGVTFFIALKTVYGSIHVMRQRWLNFIYWIILIEGDIQN